MPFLILRIETLARLPIAPADRDALPLLALDDGTVVGTLGLEGRVAGGPFLRDPAAVSDRLVEWVVQLHE